jgi:DHA1 family multidrug resistance protein-like MFS transporter
MEPWRRNQLAVVSAAFVGFIGFTLVMPFLALYFRELGLSDTGDIAVWTGVTLGVTPAISALCAPLWGRIGDRFGEKLLVQRSLAGCVAVMAAMAYATRPWHLFALRALQGLVAGYGPLTLSMAARTAPEGGMARAIGLAQGAQRVAPAIGPVVGSLLAAAFGLRSAFLVSSAVYLAALVMVSTMYTDPGRAARPRAEREGGVTFGNILALENFVLLMAVIFGLQVVDRGFGPVLLLHLGELGYAGGEAAVLAGVLFSVLAVSAAIGNHVAARAITGTTARAAIVRAALAAAGALAVFMLARQTWLLVATIAVFGAAAGSAMTTAFSAAGSVIPREAHGASFGLLSSASLVGSAVSPLISGLVATQSISMVFVTGVVVLVVLALVVRGGMMTPSDRISPAVDEG